MSLVEPGNFRTEGLKSLVRYPVPEVYLAPSTGYAKTVAAFATIDKPDFKTGDAKKGAQKLYELSTLASPPLRLVLGRDSISVARGHLEEVQKEIAAFESWSADLRED